MPKFLNRIWKSSACGRFFNMQALHSILDIPEYALIEFWMYLAFWICQDSEYSRFWICKSYIEFQLCHNMTEYVWIGHEYAWIYLNLQNRWLSEYVSYNKVTQQGHTTRSLYSEFCQRSKMEFCGKIIIAFNYFCKSWIFERVLNMFWILNMSQFWIFQDCQYVRVLNFHSYTWFTYFYKFDRFLNMCWDAIMEGSEYYRMWNMSGCCIYATITQGFEYGWIMPE